MNWSDLFRKSIDTTGSCLGGYVRVGTSSRRGAKLLTVHGGRLTLRCLRTYSFAPHEIVAIKCNDNHWLGAGVRIVHSRPDYPREMYFRCSGESADVAALLARSGFVPSGTVPAGRHGLLPAARILFLAATLLV